MAGQVGRDPRGRTEPAGEPRPHVAGGAEAVQEQKPRRFGTARSDPEFGHGHQYYAGMDVDRLRTAIDAVVPRDDIASASEAGGLRFLDGIRRDRPEWTDRIAFRIMHDWLG